MLEWQFGLLIIFGSLIILMATGMPIAISFIVINLVGMYVFFGGTVGLSQLILSIYSTLTTFTLLPVPLFVLMGEVMFHSGIAVKVMDTLEKWLGRVPGRLSLLAVGAGTLFATLTGSGMSSTAMLGSVLVPEMEKRGYKKPMSLGPILGSGPLAIMIPPSSMAVLVGAVGQISVGRILIGIIIPGLLLAALFAAYIVIRCWIQPSLAPVYDVAPTPTRQKLSDTARYVLPLGIIIFLVIGFILLGIATPSEAAATGALGTIGIVFAYKRLNLEVVKKSISGTLMITGMMFLIIAGAGAFGQIIAFSGASRGLAELATGTDLPPILIVIATQVLVLILGCFMDPVAIMMITLPIFLPVITTLGFNPIWFAVIFLLNMEIATLTPPFGLNLFVMKGVAPPGTTMGDVYGGALPFLGCNLIAMSLLIAFPILTSILATGIVG